MTSLNDWIEQLFANPAMRRMGHHQRFEDGNLGLGWLYYALVRIQRARHAVVIGSYRGFVPLVIGRAFADNGDGGEVTFIDPSLVDDFWSDPVAVETHFADHGLSNVRHHCVTTQEFRGCPADRAIESVDLLFVDGYHSRDQACYDFQTFESRLSSNALVLFHDSTRNRHSKLYGQDQAYRHSVMEYMSELKQRPDLQVFDLPFDSGVTLVRRDEIP